MPFNLIKKYNNLLELNGMSVGARKTSLKGVFDRDFRNCSKLFFNGKPVYPTTVENGMTAMDVLFLHLTTVIEDKSTKQRDYDPTRSERLHWTKCHLDLNRKNVLVFSAFSKAGNRTYIYDTNEEYVVILEPLRSGDAYYLLTQYPLRGKNNKIRMKNTYKRRLPEVL